MYWIDSERPQAAFVDASPVYEIVLRAFSLKISFTVRSHTIGTEAFAVPRGNWQEQVRNSWILEGLRLRIEGGQVSQD